MKLIKLNWRVNQLPPCRVTDIFYWRIFPDPPYSETKAKYTLFQMSFLMYGFVFVHVVHPRRNLYLNDSKNACDGCKNCLFTYLSELLTF